MHCGSASVSAVCDLEDPIRCKGMVGELTLVAGSWQAAGWQPQLLVMPRCLAAVEETVVVAPMSRLMSSWASKVAQAWRPLARVQSTPVSRLARA